MPWIKVTLCVFRVFCNENPLEPIRLCTLFNASE